MESDAGVVKVYSGVELRQDECRVCRAAVYSSLPCFLQEGGGGLFEVCIPERSFGGNECIWVVFKSSIVSDSFFVESTLFNDVSCC